MLIVRNNYKQFSKTFCCMYSMLTCAMRLAKCIHALVSDEAFCLLIHLAKQIVWVTHDIQLTANNIALEIRYMEIASALIHSSKFALEKVTECLVVIQMHIVTYRKRELLILSLLFVLYTSWKMVSVCTCVYMHTLLK